MSGQSRRSARRNSGDATLQGRLAVVDELPPPSLLEDPDIELGDLATVAYIERGEEVNRLF